ncbi:MAG: type II toxin-antitoxin system VapC family toxin [Patescibacteria group bacterium]
MGQKIYLDTNLFIAFFEGSSPVSVRVERLFLDSLENDTKIVASPLITMELLVAPLRAKHEQLTSVYKSLHNHFRNIRFVDFTIKISCLAAELRTKYNISTPDCIHLATAIEEKVNTFYTADRGLLKVKELNIELV